jgi:hypothetical protein
MSVETSRQSATHKPTVSFSWADFPCIEDMVDPTFTLSNDSHKKSSYVSITALFGKNEEAVPDMVDSSDSDADSVEETRSMLASCDVQTELSRVVKEVRFSTVQVREYAVTLGDHPWSQSFPLSLDWAHTEMRERSVQEIEDEREALPPWGRCFKLPPRLTRFQRKQRLLEVTGMSVEDLDEMEEERLDREDSVTSRVSETGFSELLRVPSIRNFRDEYLESNPSE